MIPSAAPSTSKYARDTVDKYPHPSKIIDSSLRYLRYVK